MAQTENVPAPVASVEDIQQAWHELNLKVRQLDSELTAVEQENKSLRSLVERLIEHRQKSHAEMVNILTSLVTKLPINDIGVVVSRLVDHNSQVNEVCAALAKGKVDDSQLQPVILKVLEKTKTDLAAATKSAVAELEKLDAPFEAGLLQSLAGKPGNFFTPPFVRANRGFVKGQLPRERIVREFGEDALIFFKDLTTDPKLNPRPKPDEIMLAFKDDFDALFQQNSSVVAAKRPELQALRARVQKSKSTAAEAVAQKNAFLRLSFATELLHYYENQTTESPDVVFAQHLPPLIEQLVVTGDNGALDESLIKQAEGLLAFIVKPDHRNSVINNMGKSGGTLRTLRFVLAFRGQTFTESDSIVQEFIRHAISAGKVPKPESLLPTLRLLPAEMQLTLIRAISATERLRREDAEKVARAVAQELGLKAIEARLKAQSEMTPERERKMVWTNIGELIAQRAPPAEIANAIRSRLKTKYDSDEIKQSWLTLAEGDPLSFIRVFSALPYLPDGQTDPAARPVLESYVQRLMHEKYAATYTKVLNALKNFHKAKADSPAFVNFIALVKWIDPEAAARLAKDIGLPAA